MHRLTPHAALLLLTAAGCGSRHEAVDRIGDAGPVLRSCLDLLAAPEGARCEDLGALCDRGADGFCSAHVARCIGGRVTHGRDIWVFPRSDGRTCSTGEVAIDVVGSGGTASFDHGTGSALAGFTQSMTLLFSSGAPYPGCPRPRLAVTFEPNTELVYEGVIAAFGRLLAEGDDGSTSDTEMSGTVQIDAYGPDSGVMRGSLSLSGEGQSVTGTFELSVCSDLYRPSL